MRTLVIGAGPAGLATALFLKRQGHSVSILERRPQIEQKICGECLSPPSASILKELGVWSQIPSHAFRRLSGISIIGPRGSKCSLLANNQEEPPFTIPRPILDQVLLDRAREEGIPIYFGTSVVQIRTDLDLSSGSAFAISTRNGQSFEADLLVGADGRSSFTAKQIGLGQEKPSKIRHSAIMGHFSPPDQPLNGVEMHVTPFGYVGLNPLPDGNVNTIAVMSPENLKKQNAGGGKRELLRLLTRCLHGEDSPPTLAMRMKGSTPIPENVWTVSPIAWKPKGLTRGSAVLVGDSAGFVDPFTGEGLYHALVSSKTLAQKIGAHGKELGLQEYEVWHRKTFGPEELFCELLQRLLPYSNIADYVIRQLGRSNKYHLREILSEAVADRLPTERVLSPWFWLKVLWPV